MRFFVSPIGPGDLGQVSQIEREAFPTLWPPTSFRKGMDNARYAYLVAWLPRENAGGPQALEGNGKHQEAEGSGPFLRGLLQGVRRFVAPRPVPDNGRFDIGFVGLWFGEDEAHITAIAVREGWRRRGIGELLMIAALEMARMRRCNYMSLEVRVSNKAAQSLYSKYGFKEVGVRRGYYNDNHEDALIMTTGRIDSSSYREEMSRLVETFKQKKGDFALTFA